MSENLIIVLILLFACSCSHSNTEKKSADNTPTKKQKTPSRKEQVQDWVDKNINVFYLERQKKGLEYYKKRNLNDADSLRAYILQQDTLYISDLNATIYNANDLEGSDADYYYLIRDNISGLIYPIERGCWPTLYDNYVTTKDACDIYFKNVLLKSNSPQLDGMETFLNNCKALKHKLLTKEELISLMTVFRDKQTPILTENQLETAFRKSVAYIKKDGGKVNSYYLKKFKQELVKRLKSDFSIIYAGNFGTFTIVEFGPGVVFEHSVFKDCVKEELEAIRKGPKINLYSLREINVDLGEYKGKRMTYLR
jgi:hypothetical protein